jgi:hypothetical protein
VNKVQRCIEYIRERAVDCEEFQIDRYVISELVLGASGEVFIAPSTVYKAINQMIEAGEIKGDKGQRVYVGRWIEGDEMRDALDTDGGIPRLVSDRWARETALKLGTTVKKLHDCLYAAQTYYRTIELSNCTYGLSYTKVRPSAPFVMVSEQQRETVTTESPAIMNLENKQEEITLVGVPTTNLKGVILGSHSSVYITEWDVEVCLTEWSGRIPRNEAVGELQRLIAFAQRAIEIIQSENVAVSKQPEKAINPGLYTRWGMKKKAWRVWRSQQHLWRQVNAVVDVALDLVIDRAASWREEIVEQAVQEDQQPRVICAWCQWCDSGDVYQTGEFAHAHEYTCRNCHRKFQLKKGVVYQAANGWYVAASQNCFFDWFVYRDDGALFTFAATLDAAKRLADEGRESR